MGKREAVIAYFGNEKAARNALEYTIKAFLMSYTPAKIISDGKELAILDSGVRELVKNWIMDHSKIKREYQTIDEWHAAWSVGDCSDWFIDRYGNLCAYYYY